METEGGRAAMKAMALLYHDVVEPDCFAASGFRSPDAEIYKLTTGDFARHLEAIASSGRQATEDIGELQSRSTAGGNVPLFLTFDDGGASATHTADLLEKHGWRGHFFIPTDYVGTAGFIDRRALRDLHERGHVLGSHSCSHPPRISHLPDAELQREWSQSVRSLEDILGAQVTVASVPGGFYSTRVARFASEAGVRSLFNSEPATRSFQVGDCTVWGRFGLQRDSPAERARQFASLDRGALWRESTYWNAKKLMKKAGGKQWLAFRKWWLAR